MSRLESFIRRVTAQRDCLNRAVALADGLEGVVLELGLGNGRTYDHLREVAGPREIFVFERRVAAHPDCIPDDDHLFTGDFRESFPRAEARLAGRAALVHGDFGSGDRQATAALARWIGPAMLPFLAPGAIVVTDQPLSVAALVPLPLPDGVEPGRYHMWRYEAA
ncbi:class I SAM-dependent methyltransferase [Oceanibacterium hippocampi]|uniref:S-adenosyl-L-methionine methyltransferase n=1 Tax=Oceanibacterium hippocampi TaxID=745714 RepID=A0A1Y5RLU2_9PROT|nr:class I SAM-dependent methyltransferase [Oceanibacterium hippocampi]SLN17857.1 S-adenosyl-L-methionine methyltransferase [Oceanibacterium hippocampi]